MKNLIQGLVYTLILILILSQGYAVEASEQDKTNKGGAMSEVDIEKSESGSPVFRHKAREHGWIAPENATQYLEEIEEHVEKYVGKIATVYHEIASDLIHLDVLSIPATADRPYHVLVTSGVSDMPMKVPNEMAKFRRAELLIALPKEWPLTQESFKAESNYWPIRWLKQIGHLPHEYETWIGWGHTIPNGDPPTPIANTNFIGVMVTLPYELSPEFFQLTTNSGEVITFYTLVPLYQEEMDLKLKKGAEELEKRLEKQGIGFVLDTKRSNVARKKGWFW